MRLQANGCIDQYEKRLPRNNMPQPQFFHLAIPENSSATAAAPLHPSTQDCKSSSIALWLWVIWGTPMGQLCVIKIFYHTESRITFSTHKTNQVQSASEREMLDSCCYSFSERETGWEEEKGLRLGGSFTQISLLGFCMLT